METTYSMSPHLRSVLWPQGKEYFNKILLVLSGVLLLTFASQLSVPLVPVPLTFQSSAVILIGMTYGARYGSAIVLSYLAAGFLGAPVFANFGFGPATFLGPTGGYLLGFVPAVYAAGWLAEHGFARNVFTSFVASVLSVSFIFFFGAAFLAKFIGWQQAIALGVMPFMAFEPVKLAVVALLVPRLWKN
jgi:biotin transport system substrate-specific component